MDRCRICLEYKKNLCSIFDSERKITFSQMLLSVADVKITKDECICLPCRRKLRNFYDFKKQIDRSNKVLNQHLRIVNFDNIQEIKLEFPNEAKENKNIPNAGYYSLIQSGDDMISYKNTTIKKVQSLNNTTDINGPIPVLEYLQCLTEDTDDDDDDDNYNHDYGCHNNDIATDEEYIMSSQRKMSTNSYKNKGTDKGSKIKKSVKVLIKPIVLDYIRLSRANLTRKTKTLSHKSKVQREKKLDMCPHCGKMSSNLKSHILVHTGEKKYKCLECDKAFYSRSLLHTHAKKHLMAGAFKCDQCVAAFSTKVSLQSHMVSHTDIKNHICTVCNKGYKRKSALERHKLLHNSSAKSLKCDLCNMSFFYKHGLRHHMRVHTGERPFKCEICSQPYSYKHDFNRHCLNKHGIFLKRRSVYILNEEVVKRERALMKNLMLKVQGRIKNDEPVNPFEGPQAALAFEQAVKALGSCQIPIDVML